MKTLRNLGHHERILRFTIGFVLLALSGFSIFPGWGDLILMIVGLIALLTGIVGYCPAWHAVGINTCKVDHQHSTAQKEGRLHEEDHPSIPQS